MPKPSVPATQSNHTQSTPDEPTAIYVARECTILPGRRITKPITDLESLSLGDLVTKASHMFPKSGGVLVLDSQATHMMGLPWLASDTELIDHTETSPAVESVRRAGWTLSSLRAWTTIYATGRPDVHLCLIDAVDINRNAAGHPMIMASRSPVDLVNALHQWHTKTGIPWRGVAGMTGLSLVREVTRMGKARRFPRWKTQVEDGVPGGALTSEEPYSADTWQAPTPKTAPPYLICYDANKAYLNAAQLAKISGNDLQCTGVREYERGLSGWWLIDAKPWRKKKLPDPMGYHRDGSRRWVTGPTIELLTQLVDEGLHPGFTILNSYTADGATPLLKNWARVLTEAGTNTTVRPGHREDVAVLDAIKAAYKQAWGSLQNPRMKVYRPDWAHSILAQSRVNLWRRIRKIGDTTGRYPAWIATDCIAYPADTNDADAEATALGLPYSTDTWKLGTYKCEKILELGEES